MVLDFRIGLGGMVLRVMAYERKAKAHGACPYALRLVPRAFGLF